MLGVSSETLRFYERKGLIRPVERNKESRYRHYSTWELHMLLCARIYSSMGIQLDQLAQIFHDPEYCVHDILASIQQQEQKLEQQLLYTRLCQRRMQDTQNFLKDVERSKHARFCEKRMREGIYILQNQSNSKLDTDADVRLEFARWTQFPVFLFSSGRIGLRALQMNEPEFFFGIGMEETYADALSIAASGHVRYFPPQMCLYTVIETSNEDPLSFQRIQRLLAEQQIHIQDVAGDITTSTIFMTQKNSVYHCFHSIYIPIHEHR